MATIAPYGTWDSPISASDTVGGVVTFSSLAWDDGAVYWVEGRPTEGGRQVLVRRGADGEIVDLTDPPTSVRTLVHEYGGGAYTVRNGRVVYSDFADQRLYQLDPPSALTPEPPTPRGYRYADGRELPDGSIVCVRESHGQGEPVNELVRVDDGEVTVLASGRDFYSSPRPSTEGDRLLWLEWDHPNMPWDGTELMTARLGDSGLSDIDRVAGGPHESIFQPEWGPDGEILFASDRSGWWNLYSHRRGQDRAINTAEADFGVPAWVFGLTTFALLSGGRLIAGCWEDGRNRLVIVDDDGNVSRVSTPFDSHDYLITNGASHAWFVGWGAGRPATVCELDVETGSVAFIRANPMPAEPGYLSPPRVITFPSAEGARAHGVFYPPANPGFDPPEGERPPLIVMVHGGPTGHRYPRLAAELLYWTTRGFAIVDVNYRGSSSYGRDFRDQLQGQWGIADVEDCLAAARYLADSGDVDGDRLVIRGGSAGGYTTLAALAFGDAFSAGASYYGVADIALLNEHTHKFESRYLDGLVGTDPEEIRRRSPLYSVDRIAVPVILFQGLDDKVVPPEQAVVIADALADKGVPHTLITYQGEDHGFRKAETIIHSLESELAFYGQVLGFTPAGDLPEITLS